MIKKILQVLLLLCMPNISYAATVVVSSEFQIDTKDPEVTSYTPENESYVYPQVGITATFSEDLLTQNVEFTVSGIKDGQINGTASLEGPLATFEPTVNYNLGQTITVVVSGTDDFGNPCTETQWSFIVKGDEVPPSIISRSPEPDAVNVNPDVDIVIAFSSDVDPDMTEVTVSGSNPPSMDEYWENSILTLSHNEVFQFGGTITVNVKASDEYANQMEDSWSFSVKEDNVDPTLIVTVPGNPDLLLPYEPINLHFSSDIEKNSVTVSLKRENNEEVEGSPTWDGYDYIFVPKNGYPPGEVLTLDVQGKDASDNSIDSTPWMFSVSHLSSASHPNSYLWYYDTTFEVSITNLERSDGYLYCVDQISDTEVTLKNGIFTSETSVLTSERSSGTHYFHIVPIDSESNLIPEEQENLPFNITTDVPVITSDSHSDSETPTLMKDFSASISFSGETTIESMAGYYYIVDSTTGSIPTKEDQLSESDSLNIPGNETGDYWFHVVAEDMAGNLSGASHYRFIVTDAAPILSSTTHPDSGVEYPEKDITFSWTEVENMPSDLITRYYYVFNENEGTVPTVDDTVTMETTVTVVAPSEGTFYFHVRSEDKYGYLSPPTHMAVTIREISAPTVTSSSHPDPNESYVSKDITLSWNDLDIVATKYYYIFDNLPETAPTAEDNETSGTTLSLEGFAPSTYYLHLRSADKYSFLSETAHFKINVRVAAAPLVESTSHPNQSENVDPPHNVLFNWEDTDGWAVMYYFVFDEDSYTEPTVDDEFTDNNIKNYLGQEEGYHYFHVRSIDKYGYLSETAHYRVNLGWGAPYVITATFGDNGIITTPKGTIQPSGEVYVNPDKNQEFIISADYGYYIEDVKVDGESLGSISTHTFNAVDSHHTIHADFVNHSPVISGSPPSFATENELYLFTPSAQDTDSDLGDNLTFAIQNMPDWAEFDIVTGILSGTPDYLDSDAEDVMITVTDRAGAEDSLRPFIIVINTHQVEIELTLPVDEIMSDTTIQYLIYSETDRNVDLTVEYSLDDGAAWQPASTDDSLNAITPDNFEGSFVWLASQDFSSFEGEVKLKVTPDDGLAHPALISSVLVDFDAPPIIEVSPISGEITGTIQLGYTISDNNVENVRVVLEYSFDGGSTWTTGKVTEDGWNCIKDFGYSFKKETLIRLTPFDQDAGEPVTLEPVLITNLAGDYEHDLVIDGADLLGFSDAWNDQDTTMEIGPVTGEPPNIKVEYDGKVDFEDLTVFAWMWQWYSENRADKSALISAAFKSVIKNNDTGDMLSLVSAGDGVVKLESNETLDFLNVFIEADGDSSAITLTGREYWRAGNGGITLDRTYKDGVVEMAAVLLDRDPLFSATLPQTVAEIGITHKKSIDGISVYYKARVMGEEDIVTGVLTITQELLHTIPEEFVLFQNTPNPFNPATTISYSLPEESYVKLTIFNISGQQVAVIKDDQENAGTHSVVWDASTISSGVYFYKIESGSFVETKKMLLIK